MAVTDYLKGSGTQFDPYVISTAAAMLQWFMYDYIAGKYAVIACDINMGGASLSGRVDWSGNLDGFGFSVSNFSISTQTSFSGVLNRIVLRDFSIGSGQPLGGIGGSWTDVLVTGVISGSSATGTLIWRTRNITFTRVVNNAICGLGGNTTAISSYRMPNAGTLGTGQVDLSASSDPYNASNFPGLTSEPSTWVVDGGSAPRLIKQPVSSITSAYAVKGVVKVGGVAKQRKCTAHSQGDFSAINSVKSSIDGTYIINCGFYSDHVYVTHTDDYGRKFAASKAYALGDIIHPSIPNGYRYICTTAGTSAATDPTTWPTSGTLTTGSAIFTPAPVYKPETMLVVPVLIDLVTGLPV